MAALLLWAASALAVPTGVVVDAQMLAGLPESTAVLTAHGTTQTCTGPALTAVLGKIGASAGEALRGAALRRGLLAHARDGYAVLFSLAELDAGLGGAPAIVATKCDGKVLTAEDGPFRLILPNDKRGARSVRQLERLELIEAGAR